MQFSISQFFLLALTLTSPVLSCVQFSCNIDTNTRIFNAALTDNGGQKCSVTNALVADGDVLLVLPCDDGYSATFDFDNGDVAYSTPWFNGDFGTDEEFSQANIFDDVYTYWTANVWGC